MDMTAAVQSIAVAYLPNHIEKYELCIVSSALCKSCSRFVEKGEDEGALNVEASFRISEVRRCVWGTSCLLVS